MTTPLAERLLALPASYAEPDDIRRTALIEDLSKDRVAKKRIRSALAGSEYEELEELNVWLDQHIGNDPQADRIFWTLLLIDGLDLLPADPHWKTVPRLKRKLKMIGSYRMASDRMWACRHLSDLGSEAKVAEEDLLHCNRCDPDVRVRAWAAVALVSLGHDANALLKAVQSLKAPTDVMSEDADVIEMEVLAALDEIRRVTIH